MPRTYTVVDGIPTINPRHPVTKKPLSSSAAEQQQAIDNYILQREAYWADKDPNERNRINK